MAARRGESDREGITLNPLGEVRLRMLNVGNGYIGSGEQRRAKVHCTRIAIIHAVTGDYRARTLVRPETGLLPAKALNKL